MNSVKRFLIAAAFVLLTFSAIGVVGGAASMTCDGAWDSSMTGIPSVTGTTTGPCIIYSGGQAIFVSGLSSQTEAWIYGGGGDTQCWQGSDEGSWCKDYAPTSVAQAALPPGYFGWYEGYTKHWGISQNYEWYLFNTRYTALYAGQPGGPPLDDDPCLIDENGQECVSPILIPLTRAQAIKLTSTAEGVLFDLNADGVVEQTAWTASDSRVAFLAMDRNGNGVIDSGSELFGNKTTPGASNGFAALAALNTSLGGIARAVLDNSQPLMAKLLLWEDANHNGISEVSELQPATNVIADIGMGYSTHNRRDGNNNLFRYRGFAHVRTAPGPNRAETPQDDEARRINIYDVFFLTAQ
jgi:hypothetical protein